MAILRSPYRELGQYVVRDAHFAGRVFNTPTWHQRDACALRERVGTRDHAVCLRAAQWSVTPCDVLAFEDAWARGANLHWRNGRPVETRNLPRAWREYTGDFSNGRRALVVQLLCESMRRAREGERDDEMRVVHDGGACVVYVEMDMDTGELHASVGGSA